VLRRKKSRNFVCLAGYMRLLTPPFIAAYHRRILNIHPSLLPAFHVRRGAGAGVAYGVKVSGCTVHFVDENLDAGPIIMQRAVPFAMTTQRNHWPSEFWNRSTLAYVDTLTMPANAQVARRRSPRGLE